MIKLHPLPEGLSLLSPAVLIASVGHIGRLRPAPGSWGSFAALMLAMPLIGLGQSPLLLYGVLISGLLGYWASARWLKKSQQSAQDPQSIVIDEVMGQWLVLVFATNWRQALLAFVLFRLFDITKLWPGRAAERLGGAAGIMLDDIVAAGWAILVGLGIRLYWGI